MLQFVLYGILRSLKAAIGAVLGSITAILALALVVWLAYGTGFASRCYGTGKAEAAGEAVDVPPMDSAGLFELGSVHVDYPGGWSLNVSRQGFDRSADASLNGMSSGGSFRAWCSRGMRNFPQVSLHSEWNVAGASAILLEDGTRKKTLPLMTARDRYYELGPDAAMAFLRFMSETPFPRRVRLSSVVQGGETKPMYDIPTMGVVNVSARMDRLNPNGGKTEPLGQPPSDPFRVILRRCEDINGK